MLDDVKLITERDPANAFAFATHPPKHLAYNFEIARTVQYPGELRNIVFAGMGGSALPAEFLHTFPTLTVPFIISKEYKVPEFVNEHTLVICASYSGNTEETLAALADAENRGAAIAIITHGGQLADLAREKHLPLAAIPACPQPRTAAFYMYRAACEFLVAARFVEYSVLDELAALSEPLQQVVLSWQPGIPANHNVAKQLAEKMQNTTPIIYAGPLMYPAAYKWKIGANENAKNTAWCNYYPEMNHNEFIGWSSHPEQKPFSVIDLISSFEHPRVQKRFVISEKLLQGMRPPAIEVQAHGGSALEHMLYLILLGDFATTYLAILNNIDPTPVALVEELKKELG
ncbi:MAG TPA: bifunctional phosphoglucose/phosphomannose isomerase [Candidatus Saccharimonadales bacterium]